jgi:hypothetical protein
VVSLYCTQWDAKSAEPLHAAAQLIDERTINVKELPLHLPEATEKNDKICVTVVGLHVGNQILNIPYTNHEC